MDLRKGILDEDVIPNEDKTKKVNIKSITSTKKSLFDKVLVGDNEVKSNIIASRKDVVDEVIISDKGKTKNKSVFLDKEKIEKEAKSNIIASRKDIVEKVIISDGDFADDKKDIVNYQKVHDPEKKSPSEMVLSAFKLLNEVKDHECQWTYLEGQYLWHCF